MEHTGQQADLPLREVMKQRCKLIIALRAETSKTGCGTSRRGLISRVRSGKGAARSRCGP
jgi:hypothetical protein